MRQRWVWIVFGPALLFVIGSAIALVALPHPIPKTATSIQRLYLAECAGCHGANGRGSWRATMLLIHPGDLGDPRTLESRTDDYLFELVKNGGASYGRPGMPAFGYHLDDAQVRALIAYIRGLPGRQRASGSG